MRKAIVGGFAAVAVVITAIVLAPAAWAQGRGRFVMPGPLEMFAAPGSQLGMSVRELRSGEVSSATLEAGGVMVEEVRADSPASKAGLKRGDIITEFGGERVRGVRHFLRLVTETPAGRAVKATIVRGGERQVLSVTPEMPDRDRFTLSIPDVRLPRPDIFNPRGRLGVTLAPLTDQLASYFGVKEGVLVSAVEPDSPAAQAGLKAGDVITSVAGHAVNDPADVSARIREATPGLPMDVRVVREKKEVTLKATIPERRQLARDRGLPI